MTYRARMGSFSALVGILRCCARNFWSKDFRRCLTLHPFKPSKTPRKEAEEEEVEEE